MFYHLILALGLFGHSVPQVEPYFKTYSDCMAFGHSQSLDFSQYGVAGAYSCVPDDGRKMHTATIVRF
jgi:hypothetical protein